MRRVSRRSAWAELSGASWVAQAIAPTIFSTSAASASAPTTPDCRARASNAAPTSNNSACQVDRVPDRAQGRHQPRGVVSPGGWPHAPAVAPGSPRVVVTLEEGGGGTKVVLRPHALPSDEQFAPPRKGWELSLDRPATRLAGGDPGPDPNA